MMLVRLATTLREALPLERHPCQILTSPLMPPTTKTTSTSRASGENPKTRVEPGAFEAEAKATAEAEAKNEQAFEDFAGEKQKEGLTDTVDYQNFIEVYHLRERMSPLMKLAEQIHGYGQTGLYHDNIRLDKISFKEDLMEQVCQMEPIYYRRSTKLDVVFRAGRRSASREELMNAMLHYFLAAGVDDDELGDLSLERMPKPIGPAEEGPVAIYNSRTKYTALVLNLGSFARNRKRTAPSLYSDIIDYDDSGESVGLLIKSIAHAKARLFLLCEAGELNATELDFLHRRGWETLRNPNGELLVGCRTNGQGSKMTMLAGPTLVGVAHSHLPLTYMIVDIQFGKTLPHGSQGSQPSRDQVPRASLTAPRTRAGMDSIRVCISPELQYRERPGRAGPAVQRLSEWGHSLTDNQWAVLPADQKEFKLNVSEWLLNSTSANYLLNNRDHDSHTPLLLTIHATHFSPGRARAMNRNPEALQEKAERRKQRQKGQVLALVLQPLVHNVLLNLLILQVESPLAKAAKEASPPRASPPGAVENTD
ncbi:hypothetical protein AK812_SmicGene5492 [Symbiodinium microadriaticum]|uniref:Uncharacterized protein n=1 Tax=Symbiodinium microadriaticum TaxID=2951 RepID=A0A1Q9ETN2_SYMMI|nr:hypothetical protein AK812_SmicGene5492 [Symbiodinium microadriaticum]